MTESEWQTRKQRIDRHLQPSWNIVPYRVGLYFSTLNGVAVEELSTANGPADYGSFVAGKLLGTRNPNVDRPLQRIREFRTRQNPKIVVTVDMLSTGVDLPALEFIVFLWPVKSRVRWGQMPGCGTRIQYFKNVTDFESSRPASLPLIIAQKTNNKSRIGETQYANKS